MPIATLIPSTVQAAEAASGVLPGQRAERKRVGANPEVMVTAPPSGRGAGFLASFCIRLRLITDGEVCSVSIPLLTHEVVHVRQYEQAGTIARYLPVYVSTAYPVWVSEHVA
jgi:hypothetical protein